MTARDTILQQVFYGRDPFDGMAALGDPPDLQGWRSAHAYLTRAITERGPSVVVEVGVWKGGSVVTMAKQIQRSGLDAVIIAVDTWLGSVEHHLKEDWSREIQMVAGRSKLFGTFAANIFQQNVQDVVIPLPLDSINASHVLRRHRIRPDVIHIDAGHDLLSVTNDLSAWWPLLKPGGVLVGDDYIADGTRWPEVKKGFDAYFAANPPASFEDANGKCYAVKR